MIDYVVGDEEFDSFLAYRDALKAFLHRDDAGEALEQNPRMQASLFEAYFHHYHPACNPGRGALEREHVSHIVVTAHPTHGTACFGVVTTVGGEPVPFSVGKKRFKAEPRASARPPSPGELRQRVMQALRLAAEPSIERWIAENPVPDRCPLTGLLLGSLADRDHLQRRYEPATPTVDHHQPDFRTLVQQFLAMASLVLDQVELRYDPDARVRRLADDTLCARWIAHHDTGTLRWLSMEGNRLANQRAQADAAASRLQPTSDDQGPT